MSMAPDIDHGWSALNEVRELKDRIRALETAVGALQKRQGVDRGQHVHTPAFVGGPCLHCGQDRDSNQHISRPAP